jgi:transmembrane sensor
MDDLNHLLIKLKNNQCTPEELEHLLKHFGAGKDEILLKDGIERLFNTPYKDQDELDHVVNEVYSEILKQIAQEPAFVKAKHYRIFSWKMTVAATVLIALSAGLYFYINTTTGQGVANHKNKNYKNDIAPGSNKAYLTLADGSRLTLNDQANGKIAEQAGISITKTKDGQLIYTIQNQPSSPEAKQLSKVVFNSISTPRGGQYQINLPDGTKVWLNASSSLKYPAMFSGRERGVELTGEAYFEVAENKSMPFQVKSYGQTVEVLGTHFNINAYADEHTIKTTLLTGSVKVTTGRSHKIISPGQQTQVAFASADKKITVVNDIDIEETIAWKDGYFKFNEDLESIMRKISKWYDVEVVYQIDKSEPLLFGGKISRSKHVSAVLKIMESTGNIKFKIEGRRIIVMQ